MRIILSLASGCPRQEPSRVLVSPIQGTERRHVRLKSQDMNRRRFLKATAASSLFGSIFPNTGLVNSSRSGTPSRSRAGVPATADQESGAKRAAQTSPAIVPPADEFMESLPRLME